MKTRTGLYVLALFLILILLGVLIWRIPVIVQDQPSSRQELTFEEQMKVTPPPPRNLTGIYISGQIRLNWDAPVPVTVPHNYSDTITLYKIYRGSSPETVSYYTSTKDLMFIDWNVSRNTTFAYEVKALHGGETESAPTDDIIVPTADPVHELTYEDYLSQKAARIINKSAE